jgi:hypothetical protein
MAYPPQDVAKVPVGLSIDPRMRERIDALAGGTGKRSEFIRDRIVDGLAVRYGPEWEQVADEAIGKRRERSEMALAS